MRPSPETRKGREVSFEEISATELVMHETGGIIEIPEVELDADFEHELAGVEGRFFRELETEVEIPAAEARALFAKKVTEVMSKFLVTFDLDTKEKVAVAVIEAVPFVCLASAYAGKKIKISSEGISFKDMSLTDRGVYALSEFMRVPGAGALLQLAVKDDRVQGAMEAAAKTAFEASARRVHAPLFQIANAIPIAL